ncbi:MAG: flagellar hook-length control protein FliK [Bacillota bacterium]
MLPRADIVGTRPVASVEATRPAVPVGDTHQELSQRLNRIALGSFLEGEVLSRLHDGTFVVKVADAAVRMNLPAGTQVGETLDLTLVATQPRPAFLLATQVHDNPPALSDAGRLVDWIIHTAKTTGAPTALAGKAPLVASPDADAGQIAASMKDSLESSGLFYESHLEHWAKGERPLTTLLREPQAWHGNPRLLQAALQNASRGMAQAGGTVHLERLIAHLASQPGVPPSLLTALRAAHQSASAAPQPSAGPDVPRDTPPAPLPPTSADGEAVPVPPANPQPPETLAAAAKNAVMAAITQIPSETEPTGQPKSMSGESVSMINLQLNALEQHRIAWQGELWPGQTMEWEIGEDTPRGHHGDTQERTWQSVIRFELPALGRVAATIRLAGERVQVQVRAADENTATLLRTHGDALSTALAAAGSPLEQFSVKRDAET